MKKVLVLFMFAVMASGITVMAQNNDKVKNDRPSKEQRVEMMTKRMSSSLMLNDSQNAKFAPLYKKYLTEMEALRPQRTEKKEQLNDAQTDKMVKDNFGNQRKMLDLKEKYYNEFSKFLTPSQAQRVVGAMNGNMDNTHMRNGMMKKHNGMMKKNDGKREHKPMIKKNGSVDNKEKR